MCHCGAGANNTNNVVNNNSDTPKTPSTELVNNKRQRMTAIQIDMKTPDGKMQFVMRSNNNRTPSTPPELGAGEGDNSGCLSVCDLGFPSPKE